MHHYLHDIAHILLYQVGYNRYNINFTFTNLYFCDDTNLATLNVLKCVVMLDV